AASSGPSAGIVQTDPGPTSLTATLCRSSPCRLALMSGRRQLYRILRSEFPATFVDPARLFRSWDVFGAAFLWGYLRDGGWAGPLGVDRWYASTVGLGYGRDPACPERAFQGG